MVGFILGENVRVKPLALALQWLQYDSSVCFFCLFLYSVKTDSLFRIIYHLVTFFIHLYFIVYLYFLYYFGT